MTRMLDVLRSFAAWWQEGLAKIGMQMTQIHGGPGAPVGDEVDSDADREAWEEERTRLALSPWWM